MLYDIRDLLNTSKSEFLAKELEEVTQRLGYTQGRNYLINAMMSDYYTESPEVKKYILKFIRLHSDMNVEIL